MHFQRGGGRKILFALASTSLLGSTQPIYLNGLLYDPEQPTPSLTIAAARGISAEDYLIENCRSALDDATNTMFCSPFSIPRN